MRLLRQLAVVFTALGIIAFTLMVFSYDVIKIDWMVFMELQDSFDDQESPITCTCAFRFQLTVRHTCLVPGEPSNPISADDDSVARGSQLYQINCAVCHGATGVENTTVSAYLIKIKPADLSSSEVQDQSDGSIFLTISNGVFNPNNSLFPDVQFSGQCPPLNENLSVRERWDVVNFVRTLRATE
ncbi:MAG: c-type cytochrome [Anaerolineales bacterium]|nr:c-type cytochrome [Anaerolineales bacterium]